MRLNNYPKLAHKIHLDNETREKQVEVKVRRAMTIVTADLKLRFTGELLKWLKLQIT